MIEEIKHIRKELNEATNNKDWRMVKAMINRIDTIIYNHDSEVKKLNIPDVNGRSEQLFCECERNNPYTGQKFDFTLKCTVCKKIIKQNNCN